MAIQGKYCFMLNAISTERDEPTLPKDKSRTFSKPILFTVTPTNDPPAVLPAPPQAYSTQGSDYWVTVNQIQLKDVDANDVSTRFIHSSSMISLLTLLFLFSH